MSEQRYDDDQVREIFSIATSDRVRDGGRSPAESDGLTLEEVQRIGQEAGIDPALVAQAAKSLDARVKVAPVRKSLGLPVGVTRVVDLPRAPTDREWELMVTEFRSTFGARGHTTGSGGLREWSNGNLHICIEPTARGEQLRLSTLKENAMIFNGMGLIFSGMAIIMGAMITAAGKPAKALAMGIMFGGMALAAFAANVIRLPRWARERTRQMDMLAADAVAMLSKPSEPTSKQ